MMNISIICVGRLKERFWTEACGEYAKRLRGFCNFTITEVDEERIPDQASQAGIRNTLEKEGKRILSAVPKGAFIIAMCIEGRQLSSEELSETLQNISVSGKSTADFIIGGSYGLSGEVKNRADFRLSMSKMTFPHQMARMILSEQIYRAFEISTNGKYHK